MALEWCCGEVRTRDERDGWIKYAVEQLVLVFAARPRRGVFYAQSAGIVD